MVRLAADLSPDRPEDLIAYERYPAIRAVTEGESLTEIAADSRSLKHDGPGHAAFIWEWSKEEVNVVVCRVFRNLSATLGLIRT